MGFEYAGIEKEWLLLCARGSLFEPVGGIVHDRCSMKIVPFQQGRVSERGRIAIGDMLKSGEYGFVSSAGQDRGKMTFRMPQRKAAMG